jgi:hypothetical protein
MDSADTSMSAVTDDSYAPIEPEQRPPMEVECAKCHSKYTIPYHPEILRDAYVICFRCE